MQNTALALVEQITQQLETLSEADLHTIQDFVAYLVWKHHGKPAPLRQRSAEARALDRIPDLDDPSQWITVIEEGEEIDVEHSHQRLRERGFQVEISD